MKVFVLLIALCQTAAAQSIVISGDGQSIVVSGTSPQPPPKTIEPVVVTPVAEPVAIEVKQHFLVSETWCPACPRAKARFLANHWPAENVLTIAECKRRFGFSVPHVPYEFEWTATAPEPVALKVAAPNRYIQWPGWGRIDLQTYRRNCSCPMCVSIRAKQQEYQKQLREYQQASLPDDQQPCPIATVEQMLDLMELTTADTLADLGCGDGRILIAAAKRGVRGIGVELDHTRTLCARQAVIDSGVSHMVSIEQGDARTFDTSRATAITAYLYPTLLAELANKMQVARVVGSPYHAVPGLKMVQHGDVWIYRRI